MAYPGADNTRFIQIPDDPSRVYKVRRLSDQKFKQIYSATEYNTDNDRWGFTKDRIWITREEAQKVADKEKFDCEVVPFALMEVA